MKFKTVFSRFIGLVKSLSLLTLAAILLAGCVSTTPSQKEEKPPITPVETLTPTPKEIPVTRYNRYTLVEVGAAASQKDLLTQIIDVTIPVSAKKKAATVADAMAYVLLHSGYQLCSDEVIETFRNFQLPLAHQYLGPIRVKDALSILAGPTWNLQVNHKNRMVCFTQVDPV